MPIIKDKELLCQTSLDGFAVESVGGIPFMQRYGEFRNIMKRFLPKIDFEKTFSEPFVNESRKTVEWLYLPGNERAMRLSDIKESDENLYNEYIIKRNAIVSDIKRTSASLSGNEKEYFDVLCSNMNSEISDTFTYGCDGRVIFGIWGMNLKQGRQICSVITDGSDDQRVYSITYKTKGNGTIKPFTEIHRRYGHILQGEQDIPKVIPEDGNEFAKWEPEPPYGKVVNNNKTYIAVFNAVEKTEEDSETDEEKCGLTDDMKDDDGNASEIQYDDTTMHRVTFTSDKHLKLHGDTQFEKRLGETIRKEDIPGIETEKGYEFVEWDKNPEGHIVTDNVNFHARCRKIEKSTRERVPFALWPYLHNLLKWLLFLLLLALIGLLIWYLLGNHNLNFCGCDCLEDTEDETSEIVDPYKDVIPEEKDCNTTTRSGDDKGYIGYIDMHKKSGNFQFHYHTKNVPDSIVIYDGKGIDGPVIFSYGGGTHGWKDQNIEFHNQIITVKVQSLGSGTLWSFRTDCPD